VTPRLGLGHRFARVRSFRLGRPSGLAQGKPSGLAPSGLVGSSPSRLGRPSGLDSPWRFVLCLVPFVVLATLNAGGYRYGASDQAFYQPAVLKQLDPSLFPRDTPVLAAQTRLTLADDVTAAIVRASGASVPAVFAALYVIALILFGWGICLIGHRFYTSPWTIVALLAAFTLRHAIARSGTNTLEGYFQPRLLAYGLGAIAVAAFLRGGHVLMGGVLVIAALVHPTTALWFALWLAAAAVIQDSRFRPWGLALAVAGGAVGIWALTGGPLAGRLEVMDPEWRRMLAGKDYLFPLEWPAYAWLVNLGYLPLIAWLLRRRLRLGLADAREHALVIGSAILFGVFLVALVCHAGRITLAFQLQPARVFWMFDFLATIYVVWAIAEGSSFPLKAQATSQLPATPVASAFRRKETRAAVTAIILLCLSAARGVYVLIDAERPAVQWAIPDDDWGVVMTWAQRTEKSSGWLAHPLHAVRYGTSVRVAGERDVFVEAVKDAALGMYDRRIAVRTDERLRALPDFEGLTAARARELALAYDLDYLVTEGTLDLPLAFESGALRVYRLR
jgi:hypothetical protein